MISDIRLQQFRSYLDDSFEFSPAVNIIVGPNASGKTNLLEALMVTAQGSSYRVRDSELIAFNASWARLDTHGDGGERTIKLTTTPTPAKSYEFNGKTYRRLTLQHTLPTVLFEPNHLTLLSGGPEQRRSYLDALLEQTVLGYGSQLKHYRRNLAQRNALLKKGHTAAEQLFPWNLRLSELGGVIARQRHHLAEQLNDELGELYRALSQTKTVVAANYRAQFALDAYESLLLRQLEHSTAVDLTRGFTAAGPHREDMEVVFDGNPAAESASRGEARTFILALKILELKYLTEARGQTPLLLLDDVFSELDGVRRQALTTYLQPYQTFITTTDADVVVQHFTETSHIIPLSRS